jgi:hypothetical protein
MTGMPPMLAYTIQGSLYSGAVPRITIGQRQGKKTLSPQNPTDDSYWIAILDANNPTNKVQEFVVPGSSNSAVPSGLDTYMSNPAYLFAVVTQYLSTLHLPQGAFYSYLAAHGAGRQLQRLEQLATSLGCGVISYMSYALTGQCGPPNGTVAYENSSTAGPAMIVMSLMPQANGQPPYSLCDSYTFVTGPQS